MSAPSEPSKSAPKGEKRRAREREIVEAAERIFGRAGYWNATTAAIAAEVGITQLVLYRYFRSKRDLFMIDAPSWVKLLVLSRNQIHLCTGRDPELRQDPE